MGTESANQTLESSEKSVGQSRDRTRAGLRPAAPTVFLLTALFASTAQASCDLDKLAATRSRYSASGGEVLDKETGLTWQRCVVGQAWDGKTCTGEPKQFTWDQAMKQGKGNWRLPTRDELITLNISACTLPAVQQEMFPGLPPGSFWHWSSTATEPDLAWLVYLDGGSIFNGFRNSANAVRLVRK